MGKGNLGGWLLGPHAAPADGMQDLDFTAALIADIGRRYCIDPQKVFATGHSWGGDMAQGCELLQGGFFRATVPVAANRPTGLSRNLMLRLAATEAAVWTMFGINDGHFTWQGFQVNMVTNAVIFGWSSTTVRLRCLHRSPGLVLNKNAWSSLDAQQRPATVSTPLSTGIRFPAITMLPKRWRFFHSFD